MLFIVRFALILDLENIDLPSHFSGLAFRKLVKLQHFGIRLLCLYILVAYSLKLLRV